MKRLITMFLCCGMISAFGSDAVKASQWGFHAENATECLQKAIDSGAPKILVDNMGKDWIVDKIHLRSDLELTFADGSSGRFPRAERFSVRGNGLQKHIPERQWQGAAGHE